MVFDTAKPPAARGAYDRHQAPDDRARQQRDWLLLTTARVLHEGQHPTVSLIVKEAGVGRNTFYVHFSNSADAVDAVMYGALHAIEQAVRVYPESERTPRERIAGFARRWCSVLAVTRQAAWALLCGTGAESLCQHQERLRELLSAEVSSCIEAGQRAGMFALDDTATRVDAAVGALEAVGRRLVQATAYDPESQAESLADALLRLLR